MTYVVTEACIKCKYMDCIEVCPVDCFYEGENMVVINPEECIDCGVCQPECPIDAILPDTEPEMEKWVEINAQYAALWPNITVKKEPPVDADEWVSVPNKYPDHFNSEGAGEQAPVNLNGEKQPKQARKGLDYYRVLTSPCG